MWGLGVWDFQGFGFRGLRLRSVGAFVCVGKPIFCPKSLNPTYSYRDLTIRYSVFGRVGLWRLYDC